MLAKITVVGFVANVSVDNSKENKLLKLSIANNEEWTDKNGIKQTRTDWFNIYTFNQNLVKHLTDKPLKGAFVYVDGKPESNEYTAQDGTKVKDWRVNVSFDGTIRVLKYPTSSNEKGNGEGVGTQEPIPEPLNDEIPL